MLYGKKSGRLGRSPLAAGIIGCLLAAAPAEGQAGIPPAAEGASAPPAVRVSEPVVVRWSPDEVVEGTLFTIHIEGGDPRPVGATGTFGGQPLHFARHNDGTLVALAAAPLDSIGARPLLITLELSGDADQPISTGIPVLRGTYSMQRLTVAPQFGQPQPPEIQRRIDSEAARAMEVSRRSHDSPRIWEAPFVAPRESRITSGFGHGRTFNGQVQSRHTGTDFAGAVGAPVLAPARGRVALVGDFYLGGGVIYVDHGAGLVTAYLHLSEKLVREGDIVERGQTIGRVGATGRVTGPHLHWIVRYGPHSVDGLTLVGDPFEG